MHTSQGSREMLNNTQCRQQEGYNGETNYLTTNKQCWKYKGVFLHDVVVVLDASSSRGTTSLEFVSNELLGNHLAQVRSCLSHLTK
jgi:hypothetical protein